MALDLRSEKGTPVLEQKFDWKELAGLPVSKLDIDAFTRVRIILMNGIEREAVLFSHHMQQMNDGPLRRILAEIRRHEHHQETAVNWLMPADLSPIETTIGYEQVAIEVTAHLALHEPDPYVAQVHRFGLLEDFDHLYRFSALLDRLEGKDANNILQGYTDIRPGRPTAEEHRAPEDDLREPYGRNAHPLTRLNAMTLVAGEAQTQNYYLNIGPLFADPVARMLYAEIASIEEQHVTQYGSLLDPSETWLERWVLHEATEVWNYWSCLQSESDPRVKAIWQRFLDYELGHLSVARQTLEEQGRTDPFSIIPATLPDPIRYESHRDFVRETLEREVDLRTDGTRFVEKAQESPRSLAYRAQMNRRGSPSETVARGYAWRPGGELAAPFEETRAAGAVH